MGNLKATLGYARNLGAGSNDIYTTDDGTRWTYDAAGNPIVISPSKVLESPDPLGKETGSPLAVSTEKARGYEYKEQRTPDQPGSGGIHGPRSQLIRDKAGNLVNLTETDIRPYLFDPTLVQREADSALISGKAGADTPPIGTELSMGRDVEGEGETYKDPEGFTRLLPGGKPGEPGFGEERVSEEETQKIKEASQRLDQAAGIVPPGGPELPEEGGHDYARPGDRDDYRAFIVQKMGGDPTTINPHEEVMKMFPQDRVKQWYEDEWEQGRPLWEDLSVGEQEQVGKKARSDILAEFVKELGYKKAGLEAAMDEYDANAGAFFKALKVIQGITASQQKAKTTKAKEEETALYRLNRSKASREKIQKTLDESFDDKERIRLQDQLKSADEEVRHFQTLVDQAKPKPKTGGKESPISTAPAWAGKFVADKKIDPKNYVRSTTDKHGQYVEIMEDGKKVRYGLEKGSKEWVKITPGKQKISE